MNNGTPPLNRTARFSTGDLLTSTFVVSAYATVASAAWAKRDLHDSAHLTSGVVLCVVLAVVVGAFRRRDRLRGRRLLTFRLRGVWRNHLGLAAVVVVGHLAVILRPGVAPTGSLLAPIGLIATAHWWIHREHRVDIREQGIRLKGVYRPWSAADCRLAKGGDGTRLTGAAREEELPVNAWPLVPSDLVGPLKALLDERQHAGDSANACE